jgi:hypothetical protein
MKRGLYIALALSSLLALGGCNRPVDAEAAHRSWWDDHHHGEAFDHDRAVGEHRDWCAKNHDHSCEGWK